MSDKNNNPPRFRTREGSCLSALCKQFWVYELTRQLPSDRPNSAGIQPHEFFQSLSLRWTLEDRSELRKDSPCRSVPKTCFDSHRRVPYLSHGKYNRSLRCRQATWVRKPLHSLSRGEKDIIEHFDAPRQALGARATHPLVAETVEPEIPKFDSAALLAFAKRIKFRMQFIEQIAVLLCHRMRLHQVGSNGNHTTLAKDDAAMPLGSVDVQTDFPSKAVDVARTIDGFHAVRA